MGNFFAELKRRHIYRVAAAYVVVAWVAIQAVNNLAPMLRLPDWVGTSAVVFLFIGFPVALIFAWIGELKTSEGARAQTGAFDWALMTALVVVIVIFAYQQLTPSRPPSQQAGVEAARQAAAKPAGISIAVLPFTNLSGDVAQEFFSDGMTEEITAALAKIPDLRVVARTSAFQFKAQNRDIQSIGQQLHASHFLEGSVRKEGDRVRITAQLIKADDGTHVWAENYDRQLTGVFAIQEDIATAIAGALRVPLGLQQGGALVNNRTNDLESYQQYLRARAIVRARAINEAITVLEPAVTRDPNYAPAWGLLAAVHALAPNFDPRVKIGPIEEARRVMQTSEAKADMAARQAMLLDPRHAGGYVALAWVQTSRRNWAAADDLFRQALALDPNDPDVLHFYSLTLMGEGRFKQALSIREGLRTLEPFVPVYNIFTAEVMQANGQGEATIPLLVAIPPGGATGFYRNVYLARAYAAAGRYGEAADTLLAIPANQNQVSRGSLEDAARLLRGAPAKAPDALPVLEGELNFVYAHIGAPNRLLDAPERSLAIDSAESPVFRLIWLALNVPLRKAERFKAFVRKAHLVDYWRERGWPDLCRPVGADDFVCD